MHPSYERLIDIKIKNTVKGLNNHQFKTTVVNTKEEARELVKQIIPTQSVVSFGGSMTLQEAGIVDLLKSGDYQLLDRGIPGISADEKASIERAVFSADYYLLSANALTEDGQMYNVDGYCNRVSALLFGPKNVIVVVGYNKIVDNIEAARERVKQIAAPANCLRLNLPNPCTVTGHCMNCTSPYRICNGEVVVSYQKTDRIQVIIVKEELGF